MDSSVTSTVERKIITATRKAVVPPPPPSIGSTSVTSTREKIPLRPPPPPSIGSASSVSGKSSTVGSKRGSEGGSSSRSEKKRRTGLSAYCPSESSDDEPEMTQEQRHRLMIDLRKIIWIPHDKDHEWKLTYDSLALGRKIGLIEPEHYVDTTYCRQDLLQRIMDAKYTIKAVDQERFFELRAKLASFVDMEGIHFHNREAIRIANIDVMMGCMLSNPRNSRGESLLKPNELLYFVDLCGAPGGASEYLLWKKKWYAKGFGFSAKNDGLMWDLPVKPHYSAESFEICYGFWGEKGNGDIYNPEEVQFFSRHVRRSTDFVGAHVVIAQGGDTTSGDEDRKELRVKYMIMSEVSVALDVLREGGHFVLKIHDMFTPFTVGLVYLLYRAFESVAIYKPETGMPASSERYILCKYRKANRYILEIQRYLMDCLVFFRNTQRLHKTQFDEIADILHLVPPEIMRESYQFHQYILHANQELGALQLKQTDEINRNIRNRTILTNYLHSKMEYLRNKAASLWGVQEFHLKGKFTDAETPELRAAKLVRPYPTDILKSMVRDGEQTLSWDNMYEELVKPEEWNFVPIGRDRGFFLGLGGRAVFQFNGTEWVKTEDKLELCNNTLIYGDLIDEITILEDKQIIKTGLHIIDAMLLGGKDIRALPFLERNELCQKFARSMNKGVRDDLSAVRCERAYRLNELSEVLSTIRNHRLKGGVDGPSKHIILPVFEPQNEESKISLRPRRNPLVFKPAGFSIFKTSKGGGVEGDFLYSLQNRLNWRLTDDVNVDPQFTGWAEDAKEKYGPIHGATIINFLREKSKKKK